MESFNKAIISGNVVRDPELKGSGTSSILALCVVVTDRRKNQAGEWEDVPNFIECALFGRRAESLSNMIHKGDRVQIIGKLRQRSWEQDGKKRSTVEVNIDQIEFRPKGQPKPDTYGVDVPF